MKSNVKNFMIATAGVLLAVSSLHANHDPMSDSTHIWQEQPVPPFSGGFQHGNPFPAGAFGGLVIHTAQENRIEDPPKQGGGHGGQGEPQGLSGPSSWTPLSSFISLETIEGSASAGLAGSESIATILQAASVPAGGGFGVPRLPSPSTDGVSFSIASGRSSVPAPGALALFGLAFAGGAGTRRRRR